MARAGHPLTRGNGTLGFDALRQFPIASTPLRDEVARDGRPVRNARGHFCRTVGVTTS
jgi:hypothetical protein